jgi:hypothetical protein
MLSLHREDFYMRSIALRHVLMFMLIASPMAACGSDREERGLTPAGEVAAPESEREMEMTEEERERKFQKEMQGKEIEEFDAAEKSAQE